MSGTPRADLLIDVQVAHALLREQHPDLASNALREFESGWDNQLFRLGEDLLLRLPRRAAAAELLRHEQRWLPIIKSRVALPIPAPIRVGAPSPSYPWHWSIVPWFAGDPADRSMLVKQGETLARFLRELHVAAPLDAPRNPVRGVPLIAREQVVRERMQRVRARGAHVDRELESVWERALQSPMDGSDTWIHGDLHPRNVLSKDGRIVAILDWGDLAQGDPATDLASVWLLLSEAEDRQRALRGYAASEATYQRARGWAVLFGITLLDTGLVDDPRHAAVGAATLARVKQGP